MNATLTIKCSYIQDEHLSGWSYEGVVDVDGQQYMYCGVSEEQVQAWASSLMERLDPPKATEVTFTWNGEVWV